MSQLQNIQFTGKVRLDWSVLTLMDLSLLQAVYLTDAEAADKNTEGCLETFAHCLAVQCPHVQLILQGKPVWIIPVSDSDRMAKAGQEADL
jgi:hypothetical protein